MTKEDELRLAIRAVNRQLYDLDYSLKRIRAAKIKEDYIRSTKNLMKQFIKNRSVYTEKLRELKNT